MTLLHDMQIYDPFTTRRAFVNPSGQAVAADGLTRLVGAMWAGSTNDTYFWTLANNGAASAASLTNSVVTVTSGTANNGYGSIVSVRHARFLFVNPNRWRGFLRLTSLTAADCTRYFGAMDITAGNPPTLNNGFYFKVASGGGVSVVTKLSTTTEVAVNTGFNGTLGSTYTIPDTNYHGFEIIYYMAAAWFIVDGSLLHKVTPTTALMNDEMNIHCFAMSLNSGSGTTSGSMEIGAMSILRHGKETTRPQFQNLAANATTTLKRGTGSLHRIILNSAGSGNTITIYDNTAASGTIIATVSPSSAQPLDYDLDFQFGLTIVISGGTPSNITVVYD